jgi:hypothetical protein
MASLTKARIIGNNNIAYMPELYTKYEIIYINNEDYSIQIGGQEGSQYFLLDKGEFYAQIKGHFDTYLRYHLYDIDSQLSKNDELRNSLLNLEDFQVVKVGEFEIHKIVLFGENNTKFGIQGFPVLYNNYITDYETNHIQKLLNN